MKKYTRSIALLCLTFSISACGGGSSDNGVAFFGALIQGDTAGHRQATALRHGANEPIEQVEICAFGECSITDGAGTWGIVSGEEFNGGNALFTIKGHGIDGTAIVSVPEGSRSVELEFIHGTGNEISVHLHTVDGKDVSAEGHH